MNKNFLKKVFDNVVSKTLLTILSIFASIIGIYAFLQEQEAELRYEIIADYNVLDFNADINKLEVFYDSTNLKSAKENLRIFTVKIINSGNKSITKDYYDENDPVGISILRGRIIEKPEVIQASNNYLTRNLKITQYSHNHISLSRVILEQNEYFVIKLLVLHEKNLTPELTSTGKIAGQKSIEVINLIDVKEDITFFEKTYYGNFLVQLTRLISYFIVGAIIIGFFVAMSIAIDSSRFKKKIKNHIKEFKQLETYQYTKIDDAIFERYESRDTFILVRMLDHLKDEEKLNHIYNTLVKGMNSKEFRRFRRFDDPETDRYYTMDSWDTINLMIKDGLIFKDHDKLVINKAMKDTLDKFVAFLESKGEIPKHRGRVYRNDNIDLYNNEEI